MWSLLATLDFFKNKRGCQDIEDSICQRVMNQAYVNRIIQLMSQRPEQGKRLIGLGPIALWELWQRILEMDEQQQQQRASNPKRTRQSGGGRKKAGNVLCRLLVALLYLRQHWTMQSMAECLDCAESTVWNYIHEMIPYLRIALPASLLEQWQRECPSIERSELEQWLAELPDGELLVDSWEQPIPRAQDTEQQKEYYSGKKKQHTRKNQGITLPRGVDIVDVVLGEKGPRSDSKLLEQTQAELLAEIPFVGDKAYVGKANTTTPHKKPRGGELSDEQKAFNRQVSQRRVFVEHVIRVIKIFRVAKELFRMRSGMYKEIIGCVCGLVRLRVQYV